MQGICEELKNYGIDSILEHGQTRAGGSGEMTPAEFEHL